MTRRRSLENRVADLEDDETPDADSNWDLTPLSPDEKRALADRIEPDPEVLEPFMASR